MIKEVNFEILIVLIILVLILLFLLEEIKHRKINSREFKKYSEFLGVKSKDPHYSKKMNLIINLINKKGMTDLKEIAKLSGCDYYECILKIKFLKKQQVIENYYIDRKNGVLNHCSEDDKKLIEKYDQFIYNLRLQPKEIAKSLPGTTLENLEKVKKQVLEELLYLDKKDLLNGINIDIVDKKIIYYDDGRLKNQKSYVSITCESCGAMNNIPKGGKVKCEYCDRILEEELSNE